MSCYVVCHNHVHYSFVIIIRFLWTCIISKPVSHHWYHCGVIFTLRKSSLFISDVKRSKEPEAIIMIGCVSENSPFPNITKTVYGYWERFETCQNSMWFMAFYIPSYSEYLALKKKCPPNTFVQPVSLKYGNTFDAIWTSSEFMPAYLQVIIQDKNRIYAYRVKIPNRWLIKDLYQLCIQGSQIWQFI